MITCQLCERCETPRYLCFGCTEATRARLARAPRAYVALAAFLAPPVRPQLHGAAAHGGPAPLPVSEHTLTLRGPGGMVAVLEEWHTALQRDRGWGEPHLYGDTEARVEHAAEGLREAMEWAASSWPEAGALARAVRDLERDIVSIVGPADRAERGTRLGPCPAAVDGEESACGAVLRHYPGETVVTCRWCGTRYEPHEWAALRAWIDYEESNAAAA
ncbi:hypothetical protein ACH4OX_24415 [Streptomyces roseolus]|uniref:hypothetical protein n=1 Tax=Streptomyces roseolus TaxID=67358 RepID=UPI003799382E